MFISFELGKNGNAAGYSTWDPRKQQQAQQQGDHPYQEIPYGDGPGPRGPIPDVPQHYAQVPPVPQRQGWFLFLLSLVKCSFVHFWSFTPIQHKAFDLLIFPVCQLLTASSDVLWSLVNLDI